jgi:tetratricopeptide (TPR) repeat protein
MRVGRLRDALAIARQAVADAPAYLPAQVLLATLLVRLGHANESNQVILDALQSGNGCAEDYDGLAYTSLLLNQHERASALYRRATELAPGNPRYWYSLARSERSLGRLEQAETACDNCIALDPNQFPTYLLRSELRVQDPVTNHVEKLRKRLVECGAVVDAVIYLGYALAKELDDLGQFEEAFDWFAAAARARRSQLKYDIANDERTLHRIAEVFPRVDPVAPRPARGDRAKTIFIFGLPRSGSTLVERLLGGLPNVASNGETDYFSRALSAAARGPGDRFARAAAADPETVALHYSRHARVNGRTGWVIEKQPTNYLYLGTIRRALPDAPLVLITRSPIDVCFAMFRTLFGAAFPFTYDLEELARYYAAYDRLVRHWRITLGDALKEIVYEQLVHEPQTIGAALAHHCGVPWHHDALAIERNPAVSLTASASQIRRPIYRTSAGRWRAYRRQLTPLIEALRTRGIAVEDDSGLSDP